MEISQIPTIEEMETMPIEDLRTVFTEVMQIRIIAPEKKEKFDKAMIEALEKAKEITENATIGNSEVKHELLGPDEGYEPGAAKITMSGTTVIQGERTEAGRRQAFIKRILVKQKQLIEADHTYN